MSKAARVTLRQLCHLGLPGPLLLPSLLPVLRALVPAAHAGFFYCDDSGGITNLYAERLLPPSDMAAYHDRHDDQQFRRQYLGRVLQPDPVSRRSVDAAERASDYHREVLAPLGIEHFLYAIVRHGGRPLGQLSLYRGPGEPPFSERDAAMLAGVLHYLGEGLAVPVLQATTEAQQPMEEALAVLDASGHELYADAHWHRLVRLAHGNAIAPSQALHEREALPPFLAGVMAALQTAPQGQHEVHTHWGRFAFRRHDLRPAAGGPSAVALVLSRLGAEPLRLAQGAAVLGLSPQQREAAVLIGSGRSMVEAAHRMGIAVHTVDYHVRQIFERLKVRDRAAMVRVLSAAASDGGEARA